MDFGRDNPSPPAGVTETTAVEPNAHADGLDTLTAGLAALVTAHTAGAPPVVAPGARAAEVLGAELASRERRRARRWRVGLGTSVALAAVAASALITRTLHQTPATILSYTVDGAAPPSGGYVRSMPESQPVLAFSDGTRVQIMPSTRARVADLDARGARVVLEEGRAHVEVAHRPGAEWLFDAGGFRIHVHGTAFFVEWNIESARLDVQMENGVVSVDGPRGGETVVLRGRQSYSASLRGSGTAVAVETTSPAPGLTGGAHAAVPPGESPPNDPRPAARTLNPGSPAPAASWAEGLAEGYPATIVADALKRGLHRVLSASSSEDLAALADAARYLRRDDLARRALLAQRRRFPRSVRAQDAAFLLGRLDDGAASREGAALSWYDRYLRESPGGTYAGEALGRKMMVLQRQHRQAEASAIAIDYMRRFPEGIYAHAARTLVPPSP